MIVSNMVSSKGNDVPNQFIIENEDGKYFQSYKSMIAFVPKVYPLYDNTCEQPTDTSIVLDEYYWNYSRTTSKYLSLFLGSSTTEIKKAIKEGRYTLANLN